MNFVAQTLLCKRAALPDAFARGHLDHVALTARSPAAFEQLRRRLIARGASDGAVMDLGAFHSVGFEDPDGMRGELELVVDDSLRGVHDPRPLDSAYGAA